MIKVNLLPKHLRLVREPGYWKLIMVAFPLIVAGVLVGIQMAYNQTEDNLITQVAELEVEKQSYQQFIDLQQELTAEQENLREVIAVSNQVTDNTIEWSNEITALLETLPARGDSERPRISFQNLSMQAVNPPSANEGRYEGEAVKAEIDVSGSVANTETLAEFIRTLERSSIFGVAFQSASQDAETGIYSYNMTVGALAGEVEQ